MTQPDRLREAAVRFVALHDGGKANDPGTPYCNGRCSPVQLLRDAVRLLPEAAPAPDLVAAVEALLSEWETQSHIHTSLPTAARMFRAGLKRHLRAAPRREAGS